jgi:ornithine decarboxylase
MGPRSGRLQNTPRRFPPPPLTCGFSAVQGVNMFAADHHDEVDKIAEEAPNSKLFIRLTVSETDAHFKLTHKFGASIERAEELLVRGHKAGLTAYGASFHVGSQCYDAKAWEGPLADIAALRRRLRDRGVALSFVNCGGGFPTQYCRGNRGLVPNINAIGSSIVSSIARALPDFDGTVAAEPGRFIVGNAGVLASKVILRADRGNGKTWLHLDAGVYQGLNDAIYNIRYDIRCLGRNDPHEPLLPFTLAGPTCDSADVMYHDVMLPASVANGDTLCFFNAGAYTNTFATHFNGFQPPVVRFCPDNAMIRLD